MPKFRVTQWVEGYLTRDFEAASLEEAVIAAEADDFLDTASFEPTDGGSVQVCEIPQGAPK